MTSTESCTPNKIFLVINGVEDRLQVVIGQNKEVLFSQETKAPAKGILVLPQAIETGCQLTGIESGDIDRIACVRGPGAFTGLRITLALTLGLAKGRNIPLAGIDYLPLLAEAPAHFLKSEIWVMTYARKKIVYRQGFLKKRNALKAISRPQAVPLVQALQEVKTRKTDSFLLGTGIRKNLDVCGQYLSQEKILDQIWDYPSGSVLLKKAVQANYSYQPVEPMYLRSSDAEANYSEIAAKRGI